jgi:hypothetical protein
MHFHPGGKSINHEKLTEQSIVYSMGGLRITKSLCSHVIDNDSDEGTCVAVL